MKVLLTGISGFIGHHTAEALHRHGHQIRGLVRRTSDRSGFAHLPVEIAEGDVLDRPSLDRALVGVDAVVHVAGITRALNGEEFLHVNAGGTKHVVDAALARGKDPASRPRLVHVSSQTVMGPTAAGRASVESDLESPLSHYGLSKLQAEQLVRGATGQLHAVMVRPPMVYGPRDKDILAAFKLAKLGRGLWMHPGFREKSYSIIHGHDLGEGIALALERGQPMPSASTTGADRGQGVYFFTDGGIYTYSELGRQMARAFGHRPFVVKIPEAVPMALAVAQELQAVLTGKPPLVGFDRVRLMRGDNFVCSDARARKELGYTQQYDVPAGFKQTAEWYAQNGWI